MARTAVMTEIEAEAGSRAMRMVLDEFLETPPLGMIPRRIAPVELEPNLDLETPAELKRMQMRMEEATFNIMQSLLGNPIASNGRFETLLNLREPAIKPMPAMPQAMPTLVRVKSTAQLTDLTREQTQAIEEEDLLGYSAYREKLGVPGRLTRVFARLEIETFDPESVKQYKYAMMMRERHKLMSGLRQIQAFFDMDSCALPNLKGDIKLFRELENSSSLRGLVTVVRWACTPLRGYQQPVPGFARAKALEIKRACPDAEFYVEEFRRDQVLIDPLLISVLGKEMHYFEVWNEPEFEAGMAHNQV